MPALLIQQFEGRHLEARQVAAKSNVDPRKEDKENTLILGIYVFNEGDSLKDAIFVGLPIREDINYPSNPSLRGGLFVDRLLKQAKTKISDIGIELNGPWRALSKIKLIDVIPSSEWHVIDMDGRDIPCLDPQTFIPDLVTIQPDER